MITGASQQNLKQRRLKKMTTDKYLPFIILFVFFSLFSITAKAEVVSQPIESLKINAEAEYLKGEKDKPAILIMHGFLTTNQFHTIRSITQALNSEGYTTLAPTLTLDIDSRRNSIKCNTIHTHTLEKDINEINDWRDWLVAQGHKKIIVIGHSSGSSQLVEFLRTSENHNVIGGIFTSLFYLNTKTHGDNTADIQRAKSQLALQNNNPQKFSFLFCQNNYFATPQSYLSYLQLSRQHVLETLRQIKTPHYTVMGSADKRIDQIGGDWLTELKNSGTNLVIIDGANHFFSSEHEFELQDQLLKIIHDLAQ